MQDTRLYHNPRCSKSRETLDLLQQKGIQPRIIAYLETPLSADDLRDVQKMLGVPARALVRTSEAEYSEMGLADPAKTDDELIAALVAHPRLIQRPIFVHEGRAVFGRPPENVLEIL